MKKLNNLLLLLLSGWLTSASGLLFAAEVDATLDWADRRDLGTTVTAKVSAVNVSPGMRISLGTVMIALDSRLFEIRQQRARAMMKAAGLALKEAELEQERAIELYDRTVLSQFDRRQADVGLAKAQASYAEASAEHQMAALDIEYSQLLAPYDARVLFVDAAPQEVIFSELQSPVLVSIARDNQMRSVAQLSGEQLTGLTLGQSMQVAFRGQWRDGVVESIQLQSTSLTPGEAAKPLYSVAVIFDVDPALQPRAGEKSAIRLPD